MRGEVEVSGDETSLGGAGEEVIRFLSHHAAEYGFLGLGGGGERGGGGGHGGLVSGGVGEGAGGDGWFAGAGGGDVSAAVLGGFEPGGDEAPPVRFAGFAGVGEEPLVHGSELPIEVAGGVGDGPLLPVLIRNSGDAAGLVPSESLGRVYLVGIGIGVGVGVGDICRRLQTCVNMCVQMGCEVGGWVGVFALFGPPLFPFVHGEVVLAIDGVDRQNPGCLALGKRP